MEITVVGGLDSGGGGVGANIPMGGIVWGADSMAILRTTKLPRQIIMRSSYMLLARRIIKSVIEHEQVAMQARQQSDQHLHRYSWRCTEDLFFLESQCKAVDQRGLQRSSRDWSRQKLRQSS